MEIEFQSIGAAYPVTACAIAGGFHDDTQDAAEFSAFWSQIPALCINS
jgi:hypothetical protein